MLEEQAINLLVSLANFAALVALALIMYVMLQRVNARLDALTDDYLNYLKKQREEEITEHRIRDATKPVIVPPGINPSTYFDQN